MVMADMPESQSVITKQRHDVKPHLTKPLDVGETWYLVDARWYAQWKKYVGLDFRDTSSAGEESAFPGPIDLAALVEMKDGKQALKEHLMENDDYILLPEIVWNILVDYYGLVEGQEPIGRKVIEQGTYTKTTKVEVYPFLLKLCKYPNTGTSVIRYCSRTMKVSELELIMREIYEIDKDKPVKLWTSYLTNTLDSLKPENTLSEASLYKDQIVLIEVQNDDGTWPKPDCRLSKTTGAGAGGWSSSSLEVVGGSGASSGSHDSWSYRGYRSSQPASAPGLCGLGNLGNTCFMNSAIQCMSNVPELREYFLEGRHEKELNTTNPLGMRGEIAKSFGELIKIIWSGQVSATHPRNFKLAVGRFAPQFSGFQQQDSQELMAFLLDGLHEDLNRIKQKPYVEQKDANGRPDTEVAKESWINYKKRNDSVVVDTFHSLLKSTLVCPDCKKVSIVFDPFCYLSLPLPVNKERLMEVTCVPLNPSQIPRMYKLAVSKMGTVTHLCRALSAITKYPAQNMVVADVYMHRFHRVFNHNESLSGILDRDEIYIYEVPVDVSRYSSDPDCDQQLLPVYLREKRRHSTYSTSYSYNLFAVPFILAVPKKNCTYEVLYSAVCSRMQRYIKDQNDTDDPWWHEPVVETDNQKNGDDAVVTPANLNETDDSVVPDTIPEEEPPLFKLRLVNSFGTAEMHYGSTSSDGLVSDNPKQELHFSARSYLAADWEPLAQDRLFDLEASKATEKHESMGVLPTKAKDCVRLQECLDLFTTKEVLGDDDLWYCPSCKEHKQATKKFDLWALPKILVIHLKRFSYNRYWRDKLDTFVNFPVKRLDMSQYIIGPCSSAFYDLIAVSNHYGGLGGGHYTAFAKNSNTGKWYNFDDSCVTETTADSIVTKAGYVLVYRRSHVDDTESSCSSTVTNDSLPNDGLDTDSGLTNIEQTASNSSHGSSPVDVEMKSA